MYYISDFTMINLYILYFGNIICVTNNYSIHVYILSNT